MHFFKSSSDASSWKKQQQKSWAPLTATPPQDFEGLSILPAFQHFSKKNINKSDFFFTSYIKNDRVVGVLVKPWNFCSRCCGWLSATTASSFSLLFVELTDIWCWLMLDDCDSHLEFSWLPKLISCRETFNYFLKVSLTFVQWFMSYFSNLTVTQMRTNLLSAKAIIHGLVIGSHYQLMCWNSRLSFRFLIWRDVWVPPR